MCRGGESWGVLSQMRIYSFGEARVTTLNGCGIEDDVSNTTRMRIILYGYNWLRLRKSPSCHDENASQGTESHNRTPGESQRDGEEEIQNSERIITSGEVSFGGTARGSENCSRNVSRACSRGGSGRTTREGSPLRSGMESSGGATCDQARPTSRYSSEARSQGIQAATFFQNYISTGSPLSPYTYEYDSSPRETYRATPTVRFDFTKNVRPLSEPSDSRRPSLHIDETCRYAPHQKKSVETNVGGGYRSSAQVQRSRHSSTQKNYQYRSYSRNTSVSRNSYTPSSFTIWRAANANAQSFSRTPARTGGNRKASTGSKKYYYPHSQQSRTKLKAMGTYGASNQFKSCPMPAKEHYDRSMTAYGSNPRDICPINQCLDPCAPVPDPCSDRSVPPDVLMPAPLRAKSAGGTCPQSRRRSPNQGTTAKTGPDVCKPGSGPGGRDSGKQQRGRPGAGGANDGKGGTEKVRKADAGAASRQGATGPKAGGPGAGGTGGAKAGGPGVGGAAGTGAGGAVKPGGPGVGGPKSPGANAGGGPGGGVGGPGGGVGGGVPGGKALGAGAGQGGANKAGTGAGGAGTGAGGAGTGAGGAGTGAGGAKGGTGGGIKDGAGQDTAGKNVGSQGDDKKTSVCPPPKDPCSETKRFPVPVCSDIGRQDDTRRFQRPVCNDISGQDNTRRFQRPVCNDISGQDNTRRFQRPICNDISGQDNTRRFQRPVCNDISGQDNTRRFSDDVCYDMSRQNNNRHFHEAVWNGIDELNDVRRFAGQVRNNISGQNDIRRFPERNFTGALNDTRCFLGQVYNDVSGQSDTRRLPGQVCYDIIGQNDNRRFPGQICNDIGGRFQGQSCNETGAKFTDMRPTGSPGTKGTSGVTFGPSSRSPQDTCSASPKRSCSPDKTGSIFNEPSSGRGGSGVPSPFQCSIKSGSPGQTSGSPGQRSGSPSRFGDSSGGALESPFSRRTSRLGEDSGLGLECSPKFAKSQSRYTSPSQMSECPSRLPEGSPGRYSKSPSRYNESIARFSGPSTGHISNYFDEYPKDSGSPNDFVEDSVALTGSRGHQSECPDDYVESSYQSPGHDSECPLEYSEHSTSPGHYLQASERFSGSPGHASERAAHFASSGAFSQRNPESACGSPGYMSDRTAQYSAVSDKYSQRSHGHVSDCAANIDEAADCVAQFSGQVSEFADPFSETHSHFSESPNRFATNAGRASEPLGSIPESPGHMAAGRDHYGRPPSFGQYPTQPTGPMGASAAYKSPNSCSGKALKCLSRLNIESSDKRLLNSIGGDNLCEYLTVCDPNFKAAAGERRIPKKPEMSQDQLQELIKNESADVEMTRCITADDKQSYKKPCPKQMKAQMAVKLLVHSLDMPEQEPCPKEYGPLIEPDPEDISPEVAAAMIFSQEQGIRMESCPAETIKHLFPEEKGPCDKMPGSKISVVDSSQKDQDEMIERSVSVPSEGVSDSAYTRTMKNKSDDMGSSKVSYELDFDMGQAKREYVLVSRKPQRFNKIQYRGNDPAWFPGYFSAFPDEQGIKIIPSPSTVFNKAWTNTNPATMPASDVTVIE